MFRKTGWGQALLCGLLWMGSFSAAEAQDQRRSTDDSRSRSWFDRLTQSEPEPVPDLGETEIKPAEGPSTTAASIRKREEEIYLRRVAVCDKLMDVAYQLNDVRLQKKIEGLKDRAWQVYVQKTSPIVLRQAKKTDEQVISEGVRSRRDQQEDAERLTERPRRRRREEPRSRWAVLGGLFGGGDR